MLDGLDTGVSEGDTLVILPAMAGGAASGPAAPRQRLSWPPWPRRRACGRWALGRSWTSGSSSTCGNWRPLILCVVGLVLPGADRLRPAAAVGLARRAGPDRDRSRTSSPGDENALDRRAGRRARCCRARLRDRDGGLLQGGRRRLPGRGAERRPLAAVRASRRCRGCSCSAAATWRSSPVRRVIGGLAAGRPGRGRRRHPAAARPRSAVGRVVAGDAGDAVRARRAVVRRCGARSRS